MYVGFGLLGAASTLLGKKKALGLTLTLQKIVEDSYDENIRILRDVRSEDTESVRKGLANERDRAHVPRNDLTDAEEQGLPKSEIGRAHV